jgi:hypothetical protein
LKEKKNTRNREKKPAKREKNVEKRKEDRSRIGSAYCSQSQIDINQPEVCVSSLSPPLFLIK